MANAQKPGIYTHAPLNKDAREIRVLEILPKLSKDGLIRCRQRNVTLPEGSSHRSGRFKAVSYEWGDLGQDYYILINDRSFKVRSNLYSFLSAYRKKLQRWSCNLPLWIDAVSIDQSNVAERNHQVGIMKDIYSQATEVIVWLGQQFRCRSGLSLLPLRVLARLGLWYLEGDHERMIRFASRYTKLDHVFSRRGDILLYLINSAVLMCIPDTGSLDVASATYFGRSWVQQEILLARRKRLFLSETLLSWPATMVVALFHVEKQLLPRRWINKIPAAVWEANSYPDFFSTLRTFSHTVCESPHDHVYAFLGIVENGTSFPVNYNSTLLELLLETAVFCLSEAIHHDYHDTFYRIVSLPSLIERLATLWDLGKHLGATCPPQTIHHVPDFAGSTLKCEAKLTAGIWCEQSTIQLIPNLKDFDSLSSLSIFLTLANPQTAAFFRCLCDIMGVSEGTHVTIMLTPRRLNCGNGCLFMLSKRETLAPGREFDIIGRVFLGKTYTETAPPRLVKINSQLYSRSGLPRISIIESLDSASSTKRVRFQADDIRPLVVLYGLPDDPTVHKAAMDVLYDPVSFPLGPIHYTQSYLPANSNIPFSAGNAFHTVEHSTWYPPNRNAQEGEKSRITTRQPSQGKSHRRGHLKMNTTMTTIPDARSGNHKGKSAELYILPGPRNAH